MRLFSRALLATIAIGALLSLHPSVGAAQRTQGRNISIAYESGSATRNGYADARVDVTYYFGRCADRVVFHATYNPQPQMAVGNHRYWYNGRMLEVPPHIAPQRLAAPVIRGTVRGNGIAKDINFVHANTSGPDCFANNLSFGMATEFWPVGTTSDRQLAILNGFGFDQQGTLPPLRNSAAEAHFSQVLSAAREDSIARARAAEQQRIAARRDSIERAAAARAAEQQRASGAAGAGTATAAGGAVASSTAGGSGGPTTEAERAAAERAAAEERGRVAAEEMRRRIAEEEARQQQMEEAAVAVGTAAAGIIAGLLEANSNRLERKRIREAQRQREAQARHQAYVAAAKARYDAAPVRPACTLADVRDTTTLGMSNATRRVTLTMDQCRVSGGQSAVLMHIVHDADAPILISPTSFGGVISSLSLINAETNRGVASATGDRIYTNLPRGRYLLVVSSQYPGEIGEMAISMRKGWISDAHGSVGGAGASAKTINGFVGTNTTSSSWMDLNLTFEYRRRLPSLAITVLFPMDTDAVESMVDVGLRQYFTPNQAKLRPWVEASLGYREIFVLEEPFRTVSPAVGAGIHWRFSDEYGLALSATQIMGEAKNSDDIWTSPPPPVPLGRTMFRLGLMIH